MGNPFIHIELNTTDPKKAETFYSHLFEWKLEPMAMGPETYTLINVGDGVGGGMMKHPVPGAPSTWLMWSRPWRGWRVPGSGRSSTLPGLSSTPTSVVHRWQRRPVRRSSMWRGVTATSNSILKPVCAAAEMCTLSLLWCGF